MRNYEVNSREAVGRLLALTMITDGDLADCETREMLNTDLIRQIGMSEGEFRGLLDDLCTDLVSSARRKVVKIELAMIDSLLLEITEPGLRCTLLDAMWQVADADGRLTPAEAVLLNRATMKWDAAPLAA